MFRCHLDADIAALGELDGFAGIVDQDLTKPKRVTDQVGWHRWSHLKNQLQPLGVCLVNDEGGDVLQYFVEFESNVLQAEFAGFDFREIKYIVDDAQQLLARLLDFLDVIALPVGQIGLEYQM